MGKGSQCSCIATKHAGRFVFDVVGTTTEDVLRELRMLRLFRFFNGKIPLEKCPEEQPVFFKFLEDAPKMHDIAYSAMKAFWSEADFRGVWGTGLVWYTTERVYMHGQADTNVIFFAGLDREEHLRGLLPVRPLNRLEEFLSKHFPAFAVESKSRGAGTGQAAQQEGKGAGGSARRSRGQPQDSPASGSDDPARSVRARTGE